MKQPIKLSLLTLVFASMTALPMAPAVAGGDHYYRGHGNKHHVHKYHKHHVHKHVYNHNYRRYDSDDDEKLVYGLLLGGLFGYVIGNNQQQSYSTPVYAAPPPTSYTPSPAPSSTCLQEREYQMKVMVGGKEADAYGTACLQPDGSWSRGPAHVVRY